jgi:hypothetical protein
MIPLDVASVKALVAGIYFGFSHSVFAIYTSAEELAVFLSLLPQSLVKLRTNQLLLFPL